MGPLWRMAMLSMGQHHGLGARSLPPRRWSHHVGCLWGMPVYQKPPIYTLRGETHSTTPAVAPFGAPPGDGYPPSDAGSRARRIQTGAVTMVAPSGVQPKKRGIMGLGVRESCAYTEWLSRKRRAIRGFEDKL